LKKNRKWIYGNSKKLGAKKAEKSFEISAFLVFSRSDLNRPKDLAGAEGLRTLAQKLQAIFGGGVLRKPYYTCQNKRDGQRPSLLFCDITTK